ncbi:hypothetical protein SAMN04487884_11628 [Butyrivibrio fibrisolvens]|uniref:Uncharacterized protein n=1 Tax=Butyrivibrio fibrisolvens TaxID=831 RepID=A0A1H9TV37_BUTFI|nr:hypothetical protein [Butyrivibrio fibrisolvens]SES00891.1 hypothetical protein SAMN04487884_11628 [Butyrivibrio fibrisolvens]
MRKVVFLPLHPKMWEGFETIWAKETASPDTEVKVIPVPTYQLGYEKTVTETTYITTGYPDNAEICGLDDYDLASEHPDTIYIQNVLDDSDPLFSVDPRFYTKELRRFTDNLVYIPYNCFPEIDLDYTFLKRTFYSRLLAPSGIRNVDKIIVHSQNSRDAHLTLIAGLDKNLRQKWSSRITCNDYPRISILSKYTKDTVSHPHSWDRHLFDSSGGRKETVLFATSIFSVLEFNRPHLKAVQKVFEEYLKRKDSTALIWRPNEHLPESIMKLRPELFNDFRELLEFYINNDIGIFDETPTPTPAIILSDVYIGDECAVKELFKSTGKPILH